MTKLIVSIPSGVDEFEYRDRIEGLVCVNGSDLQPHGPDFALTFDRRDGRNGRPGLTSTEVATFVRNYLDEGFDGKLTIGIN